MTVTKGFFSIIQFCPDLDRAESANLGIVLVVPGLGFLDVRMSENNDSPKQRFGEDAFDDARLTVAKHGLEARLRDDGRAWIAPEDLLRCGMKEGNHLLLTEPRVTLVDDAASELEELFQRLVCVEASASAAVTPTPTFV